MTKAAGILIKTATDQALFLKRGPGGDYPGYWCFPGGKTEDGESAEQTAVRECREEIGSVPGGVRALLCRTSTAPPVPPAAGGDGVVAESPPVAIPSAPASDFTTFVQTVPDKFEVTIDGEHVGYAWAPITEPPEPLHPGCRTALSMLSANELDIARLMSIGAIGSPHTYKNVTLFVMRITGTGVAYRRARDEFVWRDPSIYLNEEFLARCNGLAVIFEHPKKAVLNSAEFADRVVGTVLFPYIQGNEVWCVAKIYDDAAILVMSDPNKPLSTSPAIVLGDPKESTKLTMEDGSIILIEGRPSLLDHLAICERGVWDKGGDPTGIIINDSNEGTEDMNEEDIKKLVASAVADSMGDKTKADAETGSKLDKIIDGLDGISKRCDALEGAEAERVAADKSRKDAEEKEKEKADAEMSEEDKKKKADAEEEAKKKSDAEEEAKKKADSDVAARIADVEKRLPVHLTDADYAALTNAQADADVVFQAFGDSAPRPLNGETELGYRRRIASSLKSHSLDWKDVDVLTLADAAFPIAEKRIYADAQSAAMNPTDIPDGQMRPITRTDHVTGHRVTTFAGRRSFVRDFTQVQRRVTGFQQRRNSGEH